jgi:hypothetical protein
MKRLYQSILIGTLLLAIAVTTIPYANAAPGHAEKILPNVLPMLGSTVVLQVQVSAPPITHNIVMNSLRVYEDQDNNLTVSNTANCDTDLPDPLQDGVGAGERVWELQTGGAPIIVTHLAGLSDLQIKFGDGGDANPDVSTNVNFSPSPPGFVWQELSGTGTQDALDEIGLHKFASCGFEDINMNGVFDAGVDLPATIVESFNVQNPPVGGTILETNAAALFLAGAGTNAYMILPLLGGIAGAVVTAITKAFRRRSHTDQ